MDTGSINNSNNYKCYVPILNVGADFAIFEVGYEKCESLHYWGPHKKFGYVFHYCISGKGILKIGDVTYNIKAGEVFYIAPDDQCFYQADEEDPWEYKWIYFGGMRAKSIISKTIFYDALRVAPCRNGVEFENIIDSIFTKEVTEINDICAMSGLYSFLGWLLKNFSNTAFVKTNKNSEGYWLQILNYIHINIYCNLSVAQISKAIGLERTYIYKLFKKNVGISTIDYIEHLRICMACDKILENNSSLIVIAEEVGFNDYAWFCKVFKRIVGVNPSDYFENHDRIKSIPMLEIVQDKAKDYFKYFSHK